MNGTNQRLCAWGGPLALVLTFGGMLIAGLFPPIPPTMSAVDVVSVYRDHSIAVRFGAILILCALVPLLAFTAAVGVQLKRIEGANSPMTYLQLLGGTIGTVPFISTPVFWCAAAFRADRSPELVQLLSDAGWLTFIMVGSPFIAQVSALGFAILADNRPQPAFPRWVAFLSFWMAMLTVPGLITSLFQTGPFAWNGLFAFWLAAAIFGLWILVVFVMLLRAIEREEREALR